MTLIDASTGLKLAKFINSNQLTCVEETVSLEFSQSQVHHFLLNCDSRNEEEVLGFISVYPCSRSVHFAGVAKEKLLPEEAREDGSRRPPQKRRGFCCSSIV
mmetsp:Transcript_66818/g.146489  ORF Transcript_66818/g.146489 Transcript_66818/m.146489 type:complete len:102 (+) Transcript_66818:1029-1334(+)